MAVSSYRMLIMMVFLDLILAMAFMFVNISNTDNVDNLWSQKTGMYENHSSSMVSTFDQSANNPNQLQIEQTYGNSWGAGRQLWELFTHGVTTNENGICSSEDCTLPYVKWIARGAGLLIILINIMGVMELYFIIKNKKYG